MSYIKKFLFGLILAISIFDSFNLFSQEINMSNRITYWTNNVGVPGGYPHRQTIHATIPAGASTATIQGAINSCPSGQVVQLSPGNYNLTSILQLARNGVTLRGAGTDKTTITQISSGADHYIYIGDQGWFNEWAAPNASRHVNWVAGFTQGSKSIAVTNAGDLTVGQLIFMDIKNDTNVDYIGACNGPYGQEYTSVLNPNTGIDRMQQQLNRVAAISGTNITLTEPIYMNNWGIGYTNNLVPQIWWYGAQPWTNTGIEDFTFIGQGASAGYFNHGVQIQNAYGCWVSNVNFTQCRYSFGSVAASRCTVEHCYAYGPAVGFDDYAFDPQSSSGFLIQNNIFQGVGNLILQGITGFAISYNYITNVAAQAGSMPGGIFTHGGHPNMNLFEGNVAPEWEVQNCWGSAVFNTALRNRFLGQDPPNMSTGTGLVQQDIQAVEVGATNRFQNILGNVLGTIGINAWYEDSGVSFICHDGSPGHGTGRIFVLGENSGACQDGASFDQPTLNTLDRFVNWDSANSSIVDANGYTAANLPQSYYLTGRPKWFGSLRFPPIDPNFPTYSSGITNIPAGYRAIFGVDPPFVGTVIGGNKTGIRANLQ